MGRGVEEEEEALADEEQTGGTTSSTFLSSEEQHNVDMETKVLSWLTWIKRQEQTVQLNRSHQWPGLQKQMEAVVED